MAQPKYSKKENSQKFNLKKLLGKTPTERQKNRFEELVIDKIVTRTLNGEDINNETFQEYSEGYAKRKGVSEDSVDLFLDGDLLPSIDGVEGKQKNMVKVAVTGAKNNLKAYNHNIGDTLPQRQFFGVTEEELETIIKKVDIKETKGKTTSKRSLKDIIEGIELEQI